MPNTAQRLREQTRPSARLRQLFTALVFTAVGLAISGVLTAAAVRNGQHDATVETNTRLRAVGDAIDRQVSRYTETLFGLRAAFGHSPAISRQDFRTLVDVPALNRRNPGAESIAFDRFVPAEDLAAFEAEARRAVPGFQVHPVREGQDHVVVDFLEPAVDGSSAFGLDIAADPIRRAAMEFARDTGELSATEPLSLVQEPGGPGFLLMLAAYDVSPVPVTAPARRRHFVGVLVAIFAADTMIEQSVETRPDLDVAIYDAGPTVETPSANPTDDVWVLGKAERYVDFVDIDVGSRRWRIVTDSPVPASTSRAVATATTGIALTLLVAGLLAAISLSRARALKLAGRMTADLRHSEEQLRAANDSIRGFIDVAAHDLRSPLVSIIGFTDMLHDDEVELTEDEYVKAVSTIARQSDHMNRLIEDLLTMSSIDGGGIVAHPERVVLHEAIAECLDAAGGAGRSVTVECPSDLSAHADRHHLRRILDNYLQNALKYGTAPIRIVVRPTGDRVEVRVLDHGPGVPEVFVPRLFGKFARADNVATSAQKGTGLGLSIVRGLAEVNGGEAAYEPNVPRGSCFIVRLPAAR